MDATNATNSDTLKTFADFITRKMFNNDLESEEALEYAVALAKIGYTSEDQVRQNPPTRDQLKQTGIKSGPCAMIEHYCSKHREAIELRHYDGNRKLMYAVKRAEQAERSLREYQQRTPINSTECSQRFKFKYEEYTKDIFSYVIYTLDTVNAVAVLFILGDKVCPIKITGTETTIQIKSKYVNEVEPILRDYQAKLVA